jgi:hypothetical protein
MQPAALQHGAGKGERRRAPAAAGQLRPRAPAQGGGWLFGRVGCGFGFWGGLELLGRWLVCLCTAQCAVLLHCLRKYHVSCVQPIQRICPNARVCVMCCAATARTPAATRRRLRRRCGQCSRSLARRSTSPTWGRGSWWGCAQVVNPVYPERLKAPGFNPWSL